MAIGTTLLYADIDDLYLDPKNPRLGRRATAQSLSQGEILQRMDAFTLDELALSYIENGGFWTHEALLVVKEQLSGEERLVVVEGNRRLAALKYLRHACQAVEQGVPFSPKWVRIVKASPPPPELFERVPYLMVDARQDVAAFLGFRHVTGIKQWEANEKAGFIARLIDEEDLTYEEVMRKIGSKTPTVRHLYIAYRLLLQMENTLESFEPSRAEGRFALLYMTIQTLGAQTYLHVDIMADPKAAERPVPQSHLRELANFARWLFDTDSTDAVVTDTRDVSAFGKILENKEAIEYLERAASPKFEVALRISGGDEAEIVGFIEEAANNLEFALSRAHLFKGSSDLRKATKRIGAGTFRLLELFPDVRKDLEEGR